MKMHTIVDTGDLEILVQDVEYGRLFIPRVIPDGKKHRTYRAMINIIMFNNRDFTLLDVHSFINFINYTRTVGNPMSAKEMKRTVENEYNRILETGVYKGLKNKRYHVTLEYDGRKRQRVVAKYRGGRKQAKKHCSYNGSNSAVESKRL